MSKSNSTDQVTMILNKFYLTWQLDFVWVQDIPHLHPMAGGSNPPTPPWMENYWARYQNTKQSYAFVLLLSSWRRGGFMIKSRCQDYKLETQHFTFEHICQITSITVEKRFSKEKILYFSFQSNKGYKKKQFRHANCHHHPDSDLYLKQNSLSALCRKSTGRT